MGPEIVVKSCALREKVQSNRRTSLHVFALFLQQIRPVLNLDVPLTHPPNRASRAWRMPFANPFMIAQRGVVPERPRNRGEGGYAETLQGSPTMYGSLKGRNNTPR